MEDELFDSSVRKIDDRAYCQAVSRASSKIDSMLREYGRAVDGYDLASLPVLTDGGLSVTGE